VGQRKEEEQSRERSRQNSGYQEIKRESIFQVTPELGKKSDGVE